MRFCNSQDRFRQPVFKINWSATLAERKADQNEATSNRWFTLPQLKLVQMRIFFALLLHTLPDHRLICANRESFAFTIYAGWIYWLSVHRRKKAQLPSVANFLGLPIITKL